MEDTKKQIDRAALLEDTKPAEQMDTARAKDFVSEVLQKDKEANRARRNIFWYASMAVAVACVAVAFVVIGQRRDAGSLGSPAQLQEMSSIHATVATVDSTITESVDSLTVAPTNEE